MLIFVQVCRTIDKKFSVLKYIGSEEQMRAMVSTKWKLVLQETGSEERRF